VLIELTTLSFSVHVKLFYRIMLYYIVQTQWVTAVTNLPCDLASSASQYEAWTAKMASCYKHKPRKLSNLSSSRIKIDATRWRHSALFGASSQQHSSETECSNNTECNHINLYMPKTPLVTTGRRKINQTI